jgi:hypothetical protein
VREEDAVETVRFYDVDTGRVATIPASELAPGAVRARVEGIDGVVWLLPDKLRPGEIRHPPFDEATREYIRRIQAAFAEQRPLSFDEWEDGFRRDADPAREIAIWSHAAAVYAESTAGEPDAERRRDVYRCVVTCMVSGPDTVWHVLKPEVLTREEAGKVIDRFFGRAG